MRVLVIKTAGLGYDGLTKVVLNLLNFFPKGNYVFDSVVIREPTKEYRDAFESKGGRVYILERSFRNLFKYLIELSALIKREKYDVVHAHGNSRTLCFEMMAAKMAGCKIRIAHCHNTSCTHKIAHYLLTPFFFSSYTVGFACSKQAGRWLFGHKAFKIVNNAIVLDRFRFSFEDRKKTKELFGFEDDCVVLGQVGSLTERKNPFFSLELLKRLLMKGLNYKLVFVGDGMLRDRLEASARSLGLSESVFITGYVQNVNDFLNGLDVLLFPSVYEGFGIAALEAEANGLPVLCSENIPNDVKIAADVYFLNLNSISDWERLIPLLDLSKRAEKSSEAINKLASNGYSLPNVCSELASFFNAECRKVGYGDIKSAEE